MKTPITISALSFILLLTFSSAYGDHHQDFLQCLSHKLHNYSSISNIVHTPTNPSYTSILLFSLWNLRFTTNSTPKPQLIITPQRESQIPPVVLCAKQSHLEVRIRSGGHDFGGLSSVSKVPFVILDLINLTKITVDAKAKTAWAEAGATNGDLYYRISEKSSTLGFPAGVCTTLGLGGHLSGGGYGKLLRKYGMAADHILDARIVDVHGRILDRKSMGEDLFWAIRGGGGASFGVITAWKLQLVDVPEKVTVFNVLRTLEQNATQLIHRWQYVAPRLDKDMTIDITASVMSSNQSRSGFTISASFSLLFLGGIDKLLPLMQRRFPELGLVREDCMEMSWLQSTLYFYGLPMQTPEALLNRTQFNKLSMQRKTDYAQHPIPLTGLEGLWKLYFEPETRAGVSLSFVSYGGRMDEISESSIPFPHRAGNLFKVFHTVFWPESEAQNSDKYINWLRRTYNYMTPYVSKFPRSAHFNYRDLELGVNNDVGKTSYEQASIWGKKYFKNNFDRLVWIKTRVDPMNFFRQEQSIPPWY